MAACRVCLTVPITGPTRFPQSTRRSCVGHGFSRACGRASGSPRKSHEERGYLRAAWPRPATGDRRECAAAGRRRAALSRGNWRPKICAPQCLAITARLCRQEPAAWRSSTSRLPVRSRRPASRSPKTTGLRRGGRERVRNRRYRPQHRRMQQRDAEQTSQAARQQIGDARESGEQSTAA
jgi:hypothetical protein